MAWKKGSGLFSGEWYETCGFNFIQVLSLDDLLNVYFALVMCSRIYRKDLLSQNYLKLRHTSQRCISAKAKSQVTKYTHSFNGGAFQR